MAVVYKIPYRRARAWPRPSARASKGILHTMMAATRAHWLKSRVRVCMQDIFARACTQPSARDDRISCIQRARRLTGWKIFH